MNSYNALDQFKSQQDQILEQWIQEIEENPRFESTSLKGNTNLKSHSKLFLSNLFKTLESESVPSFSKQAKPSNKYSSVKNLSPFSLENLSEF